MTDGPESSDRSAPPDGTANTSSGSQMPPQKRAVRRLSVRKKLLFGLLVTTLSLISLELVLYLCGVQPAYLVSDPYVGFQAGVPLFVRDGDHWQTNPAKLSFFNQQRFPARKQPGEYRIFCLGGSTTFGHPYDDTTSFAGWLREYLSAIQPGRQWQVINCGGISYASYRICLLMQELIQYQPDLFIIYDGHNEFLEARTYDSVRGRNWITVAAHNSISRTRLGTVVSRLVQPGRSRRDRMASEVDTILERSIGPTKYTRDEAQRELVVQHFRHSLQRMCSLAQSAGASVIFAVPAANIRHFTPFKSEHGSLSLQELTRWSQHYSHAQEALTSGKPQVAADEFLTAAKLNPLFAQGHWHAGDALLAAGRSPEAKYHFQKSIDEDVCPLRAISSIQQTVIEVGAQQGVPVLNLPVLIEKQLQTADKTSIPGNESFLDHVHHTIAGNGEIAWWLLEQMAAMGQITLPENRTGISADVSRKVLGRIDKKSEALALVQVIQVLSWAGKNAEALHLTDTAERTYPGLSEVISYRGRLLEKLGRQDEAFLCYQQAVERNRHDAMALSRLGRAQISLGQVTAGIEHLEQAIQYTRQSAPVSFRAGLWLALGQAYLSQSKWKDAARALQESLRLEPNSAEAQSLLQEALRHETAIPQQ